MGWKNIKEYYRIGHIVCADEEAICIGSPYIHDIIVIGLNGVVKKRYEDGRGNDDLVRYQKEFDADPAKLKELIQTPDTFQTSIPVYTYEGGKILEKQCEELGWPNVTHDGFLMYENMFSQDKNIIVAAAKRNGRCYVESLQRSINEIDEKRRDYEKRLGDAMAEVANLEKDFPGIESK